MYKLSVFKIVYTVCIIHAWSTKVLLINKKLWIRPFTPLLKEFLPNASNLFHMLGTKELAWRRSAQIQPLEGYSHLVKNSDGGGQFTINLTRPEGGPKQAARRVTFIAEDGPGSYHMAYAVIYHLDRILGVRGTVSCTR